MALHHSPVWGAVVTDPVIRGGYSVAETAADWLRWCADRRGRSPETVRAYTSTLEAFTEFVGERAVSAVVRQDVEAFLERPRRRVAAPSPATMNRELACLRSFFGWCVEQELLGKSPALAVHGQTQRKRMPKPIDDETWCGWWLSDMPDGLRVALGFGFFCGLRRAEIMSLTPDMVTDDSIVDFVRKGGGEHSLPWLDMFNIAATRLPSVVPGDPTLFAEALERQRRLRRPRLVGWTCHDPQEVNRRIRKWGTANGLPLFTPHQLRHSAATNLVRAGVPLHLVASLMNHSNVSITMGYVAAGRSQLREFMAQQPPSS